MTFGTRIPNCHSNQSSYLDFVWLKHTRIVKVSANGNHDPPTVMKITRSEYPRFGRKMSLEDGSPFCTNSRFSKNTNVVISKKLRCKSPGVLFALREQASRVPQTPHAGAAATKSHGNAVLSH